MADNKAETAPTSETTTVNLHNDITISNTRGTFRFSKGQGVKVPKDMADDVARMDYEHEEYKRKLHEKQVYEVNSGTMSVGGGAA